MFIYLSKRIAIPDETKLSCLAWNEHQRWIACGGENGLLKVFRLEVQAGEDFNIRGIAARSNVAMNVKLEGHSGTVECATWNAERRKLTSSDENGLIIVWEFRRGRWVRDLANNGQAKASCMKWTGNGDVICIAYENGEVIVGDHHGDRIWGARIPMELRLVEWSPDGRFILFGNAQGQVHIYGASGNALGEFKMRLPAESAASKGDLVGLHWYDGKRGYADLEAPTLAVAYSGGLVHLSRGVTTNDVAVIDTGITLSKCAWNANGTVLALAGSPPGESPTGNSKSSEIQFYSAYGQHLKTLRVPASSITAIAWEASGLRLAIAVDALIYLANIRPAYHWSFYANTLSFHLPGSDHVVFYDVNNDERAVKKVDCLKHIASSGDKCVLVAKKVCVEANVLRRIQRSVSRRSQTERVFFESQLRRVSAPQNPARLNLDQAISPTNSRAIGLYFLHLCDANGSTLVVKQVNIQPLFVAMTNAFVIIADEQVVLLWQINRIKSGQEGKEKRFHVDNAVRGEEKFSNDVEGLDPTEDRIACIQASERYLLIGRESGTVLRYTLPHLSLDGSFLVKCRPQILRLNCSNSVFAVVDIESKLLVYDMDKDEALDFERKDCWDLAWAADDPLSLCTMEKVRLYAFMKFEAEEPMANSGFLYGFNGLNMQAVLLDEIMENPGARLKEKVVKFETRALRDLREIMQADLDDALAFAESRSHPRLWRLLAEGSLERLELNSAEKAFVKYGDYAGIQFVKSLRLLNEREKQRAQVAVYFERFDEAEAIYREMDRTDLAIEMRQKLGDWIRVEELILKGHCNASNDELLRKARQKIGAYYKSRQRWNKAVQYYVLAKDAEALIECYYKLGDFSSLETLVNYIPEGSELLLDVAEKFTSVGMAGSAVEAYMKAGEENVDKAIRACVRLNHWDKAVTLAQEHEFAQIETLLNKYAGVLLDKGEHMQAVSLYRKAMRSTQAAALLSKFAASSLRVDIVRAKKLYVLAALEVEEMRTRVLDEQMKTITNTMINTTNYGATVEQKAQAQPTVAQATAATLENLMEDDAATGENRSLDSPWKGAEAVHLYLLAQRQLYDGDSLAALVTATKLPKYLEVLPTEWVFGLIAVAAIRCKAWGQCAAALSELESVKYMPEALTELAVEIFGKVEQKDPPEVQRMCEQGAATCMMTGKGMTSDEVDGAYKCRRCYRKMLTHSLHALQHCPLCHMLLI